MTTQIEKAFMIFSTEEIIAELDRRAKKAQDLEIIPQVLDRSDTTGTACVQVGCSGVMQEGCVQDDWEGRLTCTSCKVRAKRYQ